MSNLTVVGVRARKILGAQLALSRSKIHLPAQVMTEIIVGDGEEAGGGEGGEGVEVDSRERNGEKLLGSAEVLGAAAMSRKEKRKAAKKMKRKQLRKEAAVREREEEEAKMNDPEELRRMEEAEREEAERRERERREFEERERAWVETMERRRKEREEEEERRRKALEESRRLREVGVHSSVV